MLTPAPATTPHTTACDGLTLLRHTAACAVQVLTVNMVTSVTLGIVIALEEPEPDVMNRPPRDPKSPLCVTATLPGLLRLRLRLRLRLLCSARPIM